MNIKGLIAGAVITVVVGGTAYTVNQTDVVNNFATDTGLTQQQAEQYVSNVTEDDLIPYDELGSDYIEEGQLISDSAAQVDCVNYEYEWESSTLTCEEGKSQMSKLGKNSILLGRAYIKLGSDSASEIDISTTIRRLDQLNIDYDSAIVSKYFSQAEIDETMQTHSYNKAVLKAVLDGM